MSPINQLCRRSKMLGPFLIMNMLIQAAPFANITHTHTRTFKHIQTFLGYVSEHDNYVVLTKYTLKEHNAVKEILFNNLDSSCYNKDL